MTNREVVLEYLRRFGAGDREGLEPLLATDLHLSGTLHDYHSAASYLEGLGRDPPQRGECRILSIMESDDAVAVFYDYRQASRTLRVAQLFRLKEQRIREMVLVFDGRGF